MQRALLLIDLQNDFCAGGALAVPEGDSTVEVANPLIALFKARGDSVVAAQDWHPVGHGSFASTQGTEPFTEGTLDGLPQTWWPEHCVQGSEGAKLHPLLNAAGIDKIVHKGQKPTIDSYSAFFDNGQRQQTELDDWLRERGISSLTVLGLATDYCVKFSVLDALQLGYDVTVITDGCRGVNLQPQDSLAAFQEMAAAGATLMTLADFTCQ
ncbi:nicotinamidase/pyrazinamidase [Cedecea lapagei]|uniref:Nicotinamidase n=1 Tax=Cedecea lapagei TaxID=158823 RepID=A0A3S4K010_9ENTR|nr:bifunctional nicotinamidase/pyrazinamidase [Cedecea lapagei]VEB98465.1 nicotinamidase/pyrazinamidase [Cedecea lapagei]